MQNKSERDKLNTNIWTAFLFVVLISVICIGMFYNARIIGSAMLKDYENYLPSDYNKLDVLKAVIKSTEEGINNSIIKREFFIDINGFIHKINKNKIVNDVDLENTIYRMDNGQLTFYYPYDDVNAKFHNIKELCSKVDEDGGRMLYVQTPFKINKYDNNLPYGIADFVNINTDNMLNGLKENNIPYFDLRDVIKEQGLEYGELFYNTDHHWKIKTAFRANSYVVAQLYEEFGIKYDNQNIDIQNFDMIEMQTPFLGSQGRRVGKVYAGIDKFQYYVPKFETSLRVETYNNKGNLETEKVGTFSETIIDDSLIKDDGSISTNRYAVYFGRDWPLIKITNNKVDSGKILIIQDSFGLPFSAFMSLNFKNTDTMDLRHFRGESLYDYLDKNRYDLILFLYNPSRYREGTVDTTFRFK